MTYDDARNYTSSLGRFGWILGLERISKLLQELKNPQESLKFVHIAGTNGKGSTAAFCANILTAAGFRTGLFISPYVLDFRERFQINGNMITEKDYAETVSILMPVCENLITKGIVITEFEFITAVAFYYFAQKQCDYVCLETGLGGRFDATNVISAESCKVNIITSISLDHTDILGDTIEKITAEKVAVIKNGASVVNYPLQKKAANAVIRNRCSEVGAVLHTPDLAALKINSSAKFSPGFSVRDISLEGNRFSYNGQAFEIKLDGDHMVYNAITAYTAMKLLNVSVNDITAGLSNTEFPARFELFKGKFLSYATVKEPPENDSDRNENTVMILDIAHNPESARALADNLKRRGIFPDVLVLGMLRDKNCTKSAEYITPLCKTVITTRVSSPRTLEAEKLADMISHSDVNVTPDVREALKLAVSLSGSHKSKTGIVLVTGSIFLAAEVRKIILEDEKTDFIR
ncbi:MAG: bifunctional folylpolyglutamate synthase/dihydrofolate synthase [Oscillospiraceae bacterium]|nr:bifunctional folylpolyglutamate synthase/dihydrofolate synthase [Oscillospiraceae bacterium]